MRWIKACSKQLCLCALILLFGVIYVLCRVGEASKFGGLDIVSVEALEELTAGRRYIEEPEHVDSFFPCRGRRRRMIKRRIHFM